MSTPIRIVQYGLGPIGQACARLVREKEATGKLQLVGAVDIDPEKAGCDLADLLGEPAESGIRVSADADKVLSDAKPDVVLHCTTSFLEQMSGQLEQCAHHGASVISSTEELSYPYVRHPEIAARLDKVAREEGVVIHGTGVNPGYAMDTLPLAATGPCCDVRRVEVERIVDASERRLPLQQKVGAGLSKEAFAAKKKTGTFGHIGLVESLQMVAAGLEWELDELQESLEPVVSEREVTTPYLTVATGEVAGIHHRAEGYVGSELRIALNLKMYVGAEEEHDRVLVEGEPPIDLKVRGGIFGDTATVAALVNAIPQVLGSAPGLKTPMDIPVPRAFATSVSNSWK